MDKSQIDYGEWKNPEQKRVLSFHLCKILGDANKYIMTDNR